MGSADQKLDRVVHTVLDLLYHPKLHNLVAARGQKAVVVRHIRSRSDHFPFHSRTQ